MKLTSVHVTNFRCILDSNEVEIGSTTCLVGKNEAGKTAFLKALEGLCPAHDHHGEYSKTEDYPRRFWADYGRIHGDSEARVVNAKWKLEDSDLAVLTESFGSEALLEDTCATSKHFGETCLRWSILLDERKVIAHLAKISKMTEERARDLQELGRTELVAEEIERIEEKSEADEKLLGLIRAFRENKATLEAVSILSKRMPRFLYFSHYDRMCGEISINQIHPLLSQRLTSINV